MTTIRTRATLLTAGLLVSTICANAGLADTVFRSVDKDGVVVYSDRPNVTGLNETIDIEIERSNTREADVEKTVDERIAEAASIRENHAAETASEQEQLQAENAARRAANCTAAKSRQQKYNTNRKLYKPLANGEREYLSDDELDAERAEAARTVEEWCS